MQRQRKRRAKSAVRLADMNSILHYEIFSLLLTALKAYALSTDDEKIGKAEICLSITNQLVAEFSLFCRAKICEVSEAR